MSVEAMDSQRYDLSQRRPSVVDVDDISPFWSMEDALSVPPPTPMYGSSQPKSPILRAARLMMKLVPLAIPRSRPASEASSASESSEELVPSRRRSPTLPGNPVHWNDSDLTPGPMSDWKFPSAADVDRSLEDDDVDDINPFTRPPSPEGDFMDARPSFFEPLARSFESINPFTRPSSPSSPEPAAIGLRSSSARLLSLISRAPSPFEFMGATERSTSPFLDAADDRTLSRPGSPCYRPQSPPANTDLLNLPYAMWLPEQDPTIGINEVQILVEKEIEVYVDEA
ncbi:hypothetical protein FA95DRAFT_1000784 [Auriscalpium vulgare]|uniref:Uncharacterized protein n=1 Tax=Auriscalpium vulgare TaxID=40419 RepID=A0ACB8RZ11_9AGAM|nr:hypothetical protein FA95DRAFT_1000784 [Auriscalpium vulgare]